MRELFNQGKIEKQVPEKEKDELAKAEQEPGFNIEFYATDHSADKADTGSPEKLRELYSDIKRDGVKSVRYDWHWRNVEPEPGQYSQEHLDRYGQAKEIMQEAGLKEPTVILSNPPEWAKKLYQEDKEKFFQAYENYAEQVRNKLEQSGGEKVKIIQILNELNNKVFTPVEAEDLPRMCQITKEVFKDYNPDLKLMATVNVNNLAKFVGTDAKEFLPKLKQIKDNFDIIAIDYYPGTWHYPLKDIKKGLSLSWPPTKEIFKQLTKQTDLLKETMEEVATWGKDYELGEVGMPSKLLWGKEKSQRYFYDSFFRAFKHLMVDFREQGLKLPSRVGLYSAIDEPPKDLKGKLLRKTTPFPEHDFGMRQASGERKLILQGNPHLDEEERIKKPSQLSKIISYVKAPMKRIKNKE